jgi:two-component system, chemotaxis family, chemotaxis protein CheY
MKRCMIVDDSSVIRKVAKRILSSIDMVVVEAYGGYDAVGMCAAHMPDIIIVDTTLPDMTTVDFLRQVKAIETPIIPHILVLMAEFDVGAYMRAKRAGASGYLLKPFNRSHLLERFRQLSVAA